MSNKAEVVIIAAVKCVAHADTVEASEKVAPGVMLDCSTVVALDAAGRDLLLQTIVVRPPCDACSRRHFSNRSYQPLDGLESPKRWSCCASADFDR